MAALTVPYVSGGSFGSWIAGYFVLAAVASGLVLRAVIHEWSGRTRGDGSLRLACLWSLPVLAGGGLCLILDLEVPGEFWLILTRFNPESWISWGSRILAGFSILAVCGSLLFPREARVPCSSLLAHLLWIGSLALSIYPALVLMQGRGNPLWQSPVLPWLFLASALHLGWVLGPVLLGANTRRSGWVALVEIALFAVFAVASGRQLFFGGAALGYAAFYLLAGILPSVWKPSSQSNPERTLRLLAVLAIAAAFAQRAWILDAGQL